MILQTEDYSIFKFREDNRHHINQRHVLRLMASIKEKNLLSIRPIVVNRAMEVLDGQNRLLAAKKLGVPVYYQIQEDIDERDIIRLNVSEQWKSEDYMNFYVKNHNPEYMKLDAFMKKHALPLQIAINITVGSGKIAAHKFKAGEYVFVEEEFASELDYCWETILYIKKMNGTVPSQWTNSSRFWRALLKMVRSPDFDMLKWSNNLRRMVNRCQPKASTVEYLQMITDIYNWNNQKRINLRDDEE